MTYIDRHQKWQAIFSDFDQSGMTITAFCRQRKLNASTFYQWRKKLSIQSTGRFLPVKCPSKPSEPVRIAFPNGAAIEVLADSDAAALKLAISVLS